MRHLPYAHAETCFTFVIHFHFQFGLSIGETDGNTEYCECDRHIQNVHRWYKCVDIAQLENKYNIYFTTEWYVINHGVLWQYKNAQTIFEQDILMALVRFSCALHFVYFPFFANSHRKYVRLFYIITIDHFDYVSLYFYAMNVLRGKKRFNQANSI